MDGMHWGGRACVSVVRTRTPPLGMVGIKRRLSCTMASRNVSLVTSSAVMLRGEGLAGVASSPAESSSCTMYFCVYIYNADYRFHHQGSHRCHPWHEKHTKLLVLLQMFSSIS